MKLTSKGIHWVKGVFNRFENVCVNIAREVDSLALKSATVFDTQFCNRLENFYVDVFQELDDFAQEHPTMFGSNLLNTDTFFEEIFSDLVRDLSCSFPIALDRDCHADLSPNCNQNDMPEDCDRSQDDKTENTYKLYMGKTGEDSEYVKHGDSSHDTEQREMDNERLALAHEMIMLECGKELLRDGERDMFADHKYEGDMKINFKDPSMRQELETKELSDQEQSDSEWEVL